MRVGRKFYWAALIASIIFLIYLYPGIVYLFLVQRKEYLPDMNSSCYSKPIMPELSQNFNGKLYSIKYPQFLISRSFKDNHYDLILGGFLDLPLKTGVGVELLTETDSQHAYFGDSAVFKSERYLVSNIPCSLINSTGYISSRGEALGVPFNETQAFIKSPNYDKDLSILLIRCFDSYAYNGKGPYRCDIIVPQILSTLKFNN